MCDGPQTLQLPNCFERCFQVSKVSGEIVPDPAPHRCRLAAGAENTGRGTDHRGGARRHGTPRARISGGQRHSSRAAAPRDAESLPG